MFAGAALKGARLMDEARPGWFNHIDTAMLDINDRGRCVLGQLFGNFYDGCRQLKIDWVKAIAYGFIPVLPGPSINRAWKKEIARRRSAAFVAT